MIIQFFTSLYIILFITVPFAVTHQYTDSYKCHQYTVDLIETLNKSGFEAHYALRDEPGLEQHAWTIINISGFELHIESISGLPTFFGLSNYTTTVIDPWENDYTCRDCCPKNCICYNSSKDEWICKENLR